MLKLTETLSLKLFCEGTVSYSQQNCKDWRPGGTNCWLPSDVFFIYFFYNALCLFFVAINCKKRWCLYVCTINKIGTLSPLVPAVFVLL